MPPTHNDYAEVVRLCGELRRALVQHRLNEWLPGLIVKVDEFKLRVTQLTPEFAAFTSEMAAAAHVCFGKDRKAAHLAGGATSLRLSIAGNLKKITAAAQLKGGEDKPRGEERPPKPRPDWL